MMETLHQLWSKNKIFRIFLIVALVWFLIRLVFQLAYLSDFGQQWVLPDDLQVYKLTAERLVAHTDLYRPEEVYSIEYFQYAPSFALAFYPLARLPLPALSIGWMLLQIFFCFILWQRWNSILAYLKLFPARNILLLTLPAWLFFSQYWGDVAYGNIYILMALLSTLLLESVLKRQLGWTILWLGIILQIKPQCSFAMVIPLCQRDFKFLFKSLAGSALVYLGCVGLTMAAAGGNYVMGQYFAYFEFVKSLNAFFPWSKLPFLGYNHSILQTVIYFTGLSYSSLAVGITAFIKIVFMVPLVYLSWQFGRNRRSQSSALMLALAWYVGVFFLMDIVWEVTLILPILAMIWPVLRNRTEKWIVAFPIVLYVLLDFWQIASYLIWGDAILWQDSGYLLTDPAIYFPIILLVLLLVYVMLIRDLFNQQLSPRQAQLMSDKSTPAIPL
jgi:hypothetical protein